MASDVTFNQVSSAEDTTGVRLERFPLLGIYIFGPKFYYNIFLEVIEWLIDS